MAKLPSMQFYPGDWMKDPALRSVSMAARGIWMDMLCLMFESPRRGYLQQANGKPLSLAQIARMTGCATDEAAHLLQELSDAGVYSNTEHGVVFSRRLIRDEANRAAWRTRQQKHRGLAGMGGATSCVTDDVTPTSRPSSTSSSTSEPSSMGVAATTHDPPLPPTVEAIACAHPLALSRSMTAMQVPAIVSASVVRVLAAGEEPAALLAKVKAIADVVMQEWPPGALKFLSRMERFFNEYEFNKPLEEWRYATHQAVQRQERVPAAVGRQRITQDAIRAAVARRTGRDARAVDGAGAGVLPKSGAAGGNS